MRLTKPLAYSLAVLTVTVWSVTFLSTKVLLARFSPVEILVYRFAIAYVALLAVYPKFRKPASVREELAFFLGGAFGGALYFMGENYALRYSLASSVSLLVSTAPLLTVLAVRIFLPREAEAGRDLGRTVTGSVLALAGVALTIFNGRFNLGLNPLGDALALLSAASWALYTVTVRRLGDGLHPLYVTRKIFFYTLACMVPVLFFSPVRLDFSAFRDASVLGNLAFLSLIASCGAYVAWNAAINALGATKANNIIYLIPGLTLIFSALLIGEPVTAAAVTGAALTIGGVYLASAPRKRPSHKDRKAA